MTSVETRRREAERRGYMQDISTLYDLGFGWFGSKDKQIAILKRLHSAGHPEISPWLLPGAFSKDKQMAQLSRSTIGHLLRSVPSAELARWEGKLGPRYPQYGLPYQRYRGIEPSDLQRAKSEADVHVLGLLSFHPSGYVREAACRLLDAEGLRYLLLRLNDWVLEVRTVAKRTLDALVGQEPCAWVACLPLLDRLLGCGRVDHTKLVERVESALKHPTAMDSVTDGLQSEQRVTRRRCFELALSHLEPVELLHRALGNADVMVRVWAVRRAVEVLEGEAQKDFLQIAFLNKAPIVRKLALTHWQQEHPELRTPVRRALLDSNRSIREWAQYFCRDLDREAVYTEHLAVCPWAVVGLAEVGCKEQDHALSLLKHRDWRFQKSALFALTRLGVEESLLFPALQSENLSLSKTAALCLARLRPNAEQVKKIYQESECSHVRYYAFRLYLKRCSVWHRILALVQGAVSADRAIQSKSLSLLKSQLGQSPPPYAPSSEIRTRLEEMKKDVLDHLSTDEREVYRRLMT